MPTIICPQCQQSYDDEELFCPHCGAAQIPQASKFDLGRQHAEYRRTPRGAKVGALVGLVVGVLLGVTVGPWLPPSRGLGEAGLVVLPVVFGVVLGLIAQRLRRSRGSASRR